MLLLRKDTNSSHVTAEEWCSIRDKARRAGDPEVVDEWRAIRRKAASEIDPEHVEVEYFYEQVGDPYGVRSNIPDEYHCAGRAYFARRPLGDIWVWFGDLSDEVEKRIWKRIEEEECRYAPKWVELRF